MIPSFRAVVLVTLATATLGSCGKEKQRERDREEEREEEERADEKRLLRKHVTEAKNTVGAISRGAVGAYERETTPSELTLEGNDAQVFTHRLCKSAPPVPSEVPKGTKYQPRSELGEDFETGDATTGWKCLKFTITTPIRYRFEYRAGGNYKGPPRGGVDPGPNGFEVSAEGDLDGDGKSSLIIQTGVVNPETKSVKIATELFIVDELE